MKRRLRQPFLNAFKVSLILTLIVLIVATAVFTWNIMTKPGIDEDLFPEEKVQTFDFSINQFTLFDLEIVDYRFILANIHIQSNRPINLSLSHFISSEGLQLNSIDPYLVSLESLGYNFGTYPVVFSLSSPNNEMDAVLFIPITDDALSNLDLNINLNPKKSLSFDLSKPDSKGVIGNLGVTPKTLNPDEIAQTEIIKTLLLGPESFYQLDENGSRIQASFTAQSQILGVKVLITNKLSESYRIVDAHILANNGSIFDAVDKTYLIDGITNLNSQYIETELSGYLFFELLGNYSLEDFEELRIIYSVVESQEPQVIDWVTIP